MLTKEELFIYQKEIEQMYRSRRVLLAFGLTLLFGSMLLLIISCTSLIYGDSGSFITLYLTTYISIFGMIGGIVLLILRSALYNTRINNRKNKIEATLNELKIEKLYKDNSNNDK